MNRNARSSSLLPVLIVVLIAAAGSGYLFFLLHQEQERLAATQKQAAADSIAAEAKLATASDRIASLEETLASITEDRDDAERDLRRAEDQIEDFEREYRDTINTVKELDKLAKIDTEILTKYSRVSFLNENYIPSKIAQIPNKYVLKGRKDQYFHAEALPFLEEMLEEADDDSIDLRVLSAYRSFDEQAQLKGQFTQTFGSGANAFSADQGYSEHQLGTTVDITDPETNGTEERFKNTDAYKWLQKNAYRYGFILSYPEGNQFYIFEPWHWRFVGTDLARDLRRKDKNFYDLEQREISEYLLEVFD